MLELTWVGKVLQKEEIFSSVSSARALVAVPCLGSGEVLDGGWEQLHCYCRQACEAVLLEIHLVND